MTITNIHLIVKNLIMHGFIELKAEDMTEILDQYIIKDQFIEMKQILSTLSTKDDLRRAYD